MTVDMSVALGAMKLRGPVLAASGTFGYGTEVPLLDRGALGAMVSKGIFLRAREGTAPPRIAETPSGMLNAIGLQGPGAEALVRDYAPRWAEWDFPVLVNINGESASEYGELTARLDGVAGIAGFEINISCPNVEQGGLYFGNDPHAAAAVTVAGCSAVQVGTATFVNPNAIAEVHDGIGAFLTAKGFGSLDELPRYLPRD